MGEALEARALLPGGTAQEKLEAIQSRRTQKMQNKKYQRDKMELGDSVADMGEGAGANAGESA